MSPKKIFYRRQKPNPLVWGFLVVFFILLLDQTTKLLALDFFSLSPSAVQVTDFLNLTLLFNRGVSFGMLGNIGPKAPLILSIITGAIVTCLSIWAWRSENTWEIYSIAPIIGGALGNLCDRIFRGAVTDFLDFHVSSYHWPAFNLADAAISIGAGMLIAHSFRSKKESKQEE